MNKQKTKIQESSSQVQILTPDDLKMVRRASDIKSFSNYIRALFQNWRQGTVSCKGRSDVARSRKKPWKQKGTGRARVGSARSPLWRGGGIMFGPQARVRTLKLTKDLRSGVLNAMVFDALKAKKVIVLDWNLNQDKPKTALAFNTLKSVGLTNNKILLMLPFDDVVHYASFVNIPNVKICFFDQVNAYDLGTVDKIVVMKKDFDLFKQAVDSWI